jgi:hypothetical protein
VLTTLFSSEALVGALIGAIVALIGVFINTVIETWKEARRERSTRLSQVRKEIGLDQGAQGAEVILYINLKRPWWSRFFCYLVSFCTIQI